MHTESVCSVSWEIALRPASMGPESTLLGKKGSFAQLYVLAHISALPSFSPLIANFLTAWYLVGSFSFIDKSITVIKEFLAELLQPSRKSDKTQTLLDKLQSTGRGGSCPSFHFGFAICLCNCERILSLLFVKEITWLIPNIQSVGWINEWKARNNMWHLCSLLMISPKILPSGNLHLLGCRANFGWDRVQCVFKVV